MTLIVMIKYDLLSIKSNYRSLRELPLIIFDHNNHHHQRSYFNEIYYTPLNTLS